MTKFLLSLVAVLSLTACHERRVPEPETSKFTEQIFTTSQTVSKEKALKANNHDTVMVDIPILEEELPTIPVKENVSTSQTKFTESIKKINGGTLTDGLNIKKIRVSQSPARTRIVFDSYRAANTKASVSGHYTFKYDAKRHRITLILNGYRNFTALGANKIRSFSANSMIEKIYLVPYQDDSGFQCNIDLRKGATVNAFDLKAPGRIVIDIMQN